MAVDSSYTRSYNSFSGVDMHVVAAGKLLGEIQGISFTVTREKAPLYTMGSADPRSFSRGKRGIAGSAIFLVFDRSGLIHSLRENAFYLANRYEVRSVPPFNQLQNTQSVNLTAFQQGAVVGSIGTEQIRGQFGNVISTDKVLARARYHDQIPPFDIVLTAANEYGYLARMVIENVEILNCGSGMSIDDITTDESCTWVATSYLPWHNQAWIDPSGATPGPVPLTGAA